MTRKCDGGSMIHVDPDVRLVARLVPKTLNRSWKRTYETTIYKEELNESLCCLIFLIVDYDP